MFEIQLRPLLLFVKNANELERERIRWRLFATLDEKRYKSVAIMFSKPNILRPIFTQHVASGLA